MKIAVIKLAISTALLLAISTSAIFAQESESLIKVATRLVNVPVIVSDRNGRNIPGLKKENFSIFQDGTKQEIVFFADEEAPISVAILIDTSPSTKEVLGEIKKSARNFVKILRDEDRGIVVSFDAETKLLSPLTADRTTLDKSINKVRVTDEAGSHMQDSLYRIVTRDFASVKGRKAIVVLTDGEVLGKEVSNQRLLDVLIESDVIVYPIIFKDEEMYALYPFHPALPHNPQLPEATVERRKETIKKMLAQREKYLLFINAMADTTGGRVYLSEAKNFKNAFQNIADELKKQYLIGFYLQDAPAGKQPEIIVRVDRSDIFVRSKRKIALNIVD